MEFSEAYPCTLAPAFSPDGALIAAADEFTLVIREVDTLKIVNIFACLDRIHRIEWDQASAHVLCGLYDRGAAQIWRADDAEWSAKIDAGPAGLAHCQWTPDGRGVLLVAEFCVRAAVWDLAARKCTHLPGPKHAAHGLAFSPDGLSLAVVERKACKDFLALYDVSGGGGGGWALRARVGLATADTADLAWSPCGGRIAAWDGPLAHAVAVHDAATGALIGKYAAPAAGLGLRRAAWAPCGGAGALAASGHDAALRVLNSVTYAPALELRHESPVGGGLRGGGGGSGCDSGVAVYREVEEVAAAVEAEVPAAAAPSYSLRKGKGGGGGGGAAAAAPRSRYVACDLPVPITSVRPPLDKPNPKIGVGTFAWSPDGAYIASIEESMPHAVWVWDIAAARLAAALLHVSPVRGLAWAPHGGSGGGSGGGSDGGIGSDGGSSSNGSSRSVLAVVTGGGRLYMWGPAGASVVHTPLPRFAAAGVVWAAARGGGGSGGGGAVLALHGKGAFCCCYLDATAAAAL